MKNSRDKQIINLLNHFVEQEIDGESVLEALRNKKKLRVKLGIDPTASDLHIGHLVPIRLLRAFQDLGCKAVLIIGDYTARIGDPSGRDVTRPPLSEKEVKKNAKTYLKQLKSVLDTRKTKLEIRQQGEWYDSFKLSDTIKLLSSVSVSQIVEHNTFKERLANEKAFFMHEAFYPLLQAYDSVEVKADVEIGALDQLFNIAMGRTIQKSYEQEPQSVFVTPYILGTDGRKMSKSFENTINLSDVPEDIYGKVMSIPDELIESYARLLTDLDFKDIGKRAETGGLQARNAKKEIAFSVTQMLYGEKKAEKAKKSFEQIFSDGGQPDDIFETTIEATSDVIVVILATGHVKSKSDAKRIVEQGGVSIVGKGVVGHWSDDVSWKDGDIIQIGKKSFYRLRRK